LVVWQQRDDDGLRFPAASRGQVGENGTLHGHEFDGNLESSVLNGRFGGFTRLFFWVNQLHPYLGMSVRILDDAPFYDDGIDRALSTGDDAEGETGAQNRNERSSHGGHGTDLRLITWK